MKRKNSKKTGIIAAVVGLSAVSLVSVGFAAWIMTGGDKAELTSTVVVDTVQDQRYTIENKSALLAGNSSGDYDIVFGQPETMNISNAWLTLDKAQNKKLEKLSFSFKVVVNNMVNELNETKAVVAAQLDFTAGESAYGAAVDANLVSEKPTPVVGDPEKITSDNYAGFNFPSSYVGKYYRSVSVTFAWGSHFTLNDTVVNPYVFYNTNHKVNDEISAGVTYGDDAEICLKLIEALSDVRFKLTITTAEAAS